MLGYREIEIVDYMKTSYLSVWEEGCIIQSSGKLLDVWKVPLTQWNTDQIISA